MPTMLTRWVTHLPRSIHTNGQALTARTPPRPFCQGLASALDTFYVDISAARATHRVAIAVELSVVVVLVSYVLGKASA